MMFNKVPQVTIYFWIVKVLATTVGETAADFLSTTLRLGLTNTSYVMTGLFLIGLVVQLRDKRYVPALYWTVVVLISVVGTLVSDLLVDKLGVGLKTSSIIFCAILIVIFVLWWFTERSLSVHKIKTTRRELFYWAAILFTFALGTSAGDLTSEALGLGYGLALVIFAASIAVVAVAYFVFRIDGVLAFWLAYILTRPLGASTGDLLSQAPKAGGLGLGTTVTSLVFLAVIVGLVVFLTITKKDEEPVDQPTSARALRDVAM
jgi:uncharacterized membrane-anchored protein